MAAAVMRQQSTCVALNVAGLRCAPGKQLRKPRQPPTPAPSVLHRWAKIPGITMHVRALWRRRSGPATCSQKLKLAEPPTGEKT
jgi:hypothetical protein